MTCEPTAAHATRRSNGGKTQTTKSLCDLLLSSGAMEGPFRRPRPITLSPVARVLRAVRVYLNDRQLKGPL